jgi:protein-tyrosine phosphatase
MTLRRVQLPAGVPGSLWLSSMPGRFSSWREFERESHDAGLKIVVCLTSREELRELSPQYEQAITQGGTPYEWLHVPVPNFGVPEDRDAFRRGIERVAKALRTGEPVMMHCAAGMGRTGSAAACVLKSLGMPTAEALQRVRDAGSNPQNAAQSGFVEWF